MRGTRWLILVAILLILCGSGYLYEKQLTTVRKNTPQKPAILPGDTNSTAIDYEYGQSTSGLANYHVKAAKYRQIRDTPNYELEGLELRILQKDQQHYDLIKSAKALFKQDEGKMFSEGEVQITLDVPVTGAPPHELTWIKTSGVNFDSKSGKADTAKPVEFKFDNGSGKCTGATYDPTTRELHLLNNPAMNLTGKGKKSKPMQVSAAEIVYKENGGVIWLLGWSRMVRAETAISAGPSIVNLKDNQIDTIDAPQASGVDTYPKRVLHYSADFLHVQYDDSGQISKISANGNAKMHEDSEGAVTDIHSKLADLDFVPGDEQSELKHVRANGDAIVDSLPAPDSTGHRAESRQLKSELIDIDMRPGGREIDQVKTYAPGTLEFTPNASDQHRRILNGEQMVIGYAAKNAIKDFQTIHVTTVTFPAANNKTKNPPISKTASTNLTASFDGKGTLATMKQWDHFTYEEGDRRATAITATLDNQNSIMDLENTARIWDANGSTDAEKIHLTEKTGDYTADGHVMTSHQPDADDPLKKKAGSMLDGDEPVQGTAPHMTSANHNKLVHYDGGAVVWQGADRIDAQVIDIDRDKKQIVATGKVTTQFLDDDKKDGKKDDKDNKKDGKDKASDPSPQTAQNDGAPARLIKVSASTGSVKSEKEAKPQKESKDNDASAAPVYTVVTSEKLLYTDADRLARYSGGVVLSRPGLNIKSGDLQAYLNPKDSGEDSRLNHAYGDGKVEIVESRPERQRIGHGEHGEYYQKEDKVILRGHLADLYDSIKKDESHGTELTYFTSDDRLIIIGAPKLPVKSNLHRKNKIGLNANSGNR